MNRFECYCSISFFLRTLRELTNRFYRFAISKNTKLTAVSAILMGLGLLVAIPGYSEVGTAYVVLLANLIYNLALYFNSQKSYPVPYDWKRILRIFLVSGSIILLKLRIHVDVLWIEVLIALVALCSFILLTPIFSLLITSEIKVLQKQIQLFIHNLLPGRKYKDEKVNPDS